MSTKTKLLEDYSRWEPTTFFFFHGGADGPTLGEHYKTFGQTAELRYGAPGVEILIADGTKKEDALRLLHELTEIVASYENEVFTSSGDIRHGSELPVFAV